MGQMGGNYNYDAVMDVQYPFGHGLSYTTFEYSNLRVDKPEFTAADSLVISVDVKNTGERVGKEAVLLFVSDLVASLTPDNARLRGFEKVELQPGEQQTVALQVAASDLAFVGADMKWRLEEGDYVASVGGLKAELRCTETKVLDTPNK
jgi:beta-glucosidase